MTEREKVLNLHNIYSICYWSLMDAGEDLGLCPRPNEMSPITMDVVMFWLLHLGRDHPPSGG